jgi:hypothetical protein
MPDTLTIRITATTMEGLGAKDPQLTVTVRGQDQLSSYIQQAVVKNFDTQCDVVIPQPDGFGTLLVESAFIRFDAGVIGQFIMAGGDPIKPVHLKVSRIPSQWTPKFDPYATLAATRFTPFKTVVGNSTMVDVKHGPSIGNLQTNYDTLAGAQQILAKAALLNLFSVLTEEQDPIAQFPWFNHVQKIVRIDQERFVAETTPTLYENVQIILNQLSTVYGRQGYFTELSTVDHLPNFPAQYGHPALPLITIKKDYEQGNLQLTMGFFRMDNVAYHLLDCDLDEHHNIVKHSFDVVKHFLNGVGTNPIDMHEYVVEDSAEQAPNHISTIDLGYQLV